MRPPRHLRWSDFGPTVTARMQELLQKIKASAVARLTLPAGKTSTKELARFKTFLKVETHRLKILHRAGRGGIEICQARAAILDQVLQHLWANAKRNLSEQAQKEFPPLAVGAARLPESLGNRPFLLAGGTPAAASGPSFTASQSRGGGDS